MVMPYLDMSCLTLVSLSETTDDPITIHNKVSFDIFTNPSIFSISA